MESSRPTPRERLRAQQEAAKKRRKLSIGVGVTGLVVLFAAGVATLLLPGAVAPLVGLMVAGVALLVVALFLVRNQTAGMLQVLEK